MADSKGRKLNLPRKAKRPKIPRSETDEAAQNCVICLDKVSCRGKLSVCEHWFCFFCIFEWSKNTNTCPVCKIRFRCISKTHLTPGKSPVQKIRVKDVDMRTFQDDNDFVWAELESITDSDLSNYEPSSHDDTEDDTFIVPAEMSADSDNCNSSEDEHFLSWMQESVSDDWSIDDKDVQDMSLKSFDPSENSSPNICTGRKRKHKVTLSDTENSSEAEQTDDEWVLSDETTSEMEKKTNRKSQRKNIKNKNAKNSGMSQIDAKKGFHSNRRQKLPSRKFEAELNRRRAANRKKNETKRSSSGRAVVSRAISSARERDSRIGQWLCTLDSHSQASSRSRSALHRTLQSHPETRRTTSHKRQTRETSSESSGGESSSTRSDFQPTPDNSWSTRNDFQPTPDNSWSTRNDSRPTPDNSWSIQNDFQPTPDNSWSTQNDSRSTPDNCKSTRDDSVSTRNHSRTTRDHVRSTRNNRRRHRKLFNIDLETSSCSSGESWTPLGKSSEITNGRENMIVEKSERRRRERTGSRRVLKEVQNNWE